MLSYSRVDAGSVSCSMHSASDHHALLAESPSREAAFVVLGDALLDGTIAACVGTLCASDRSSSHKT